MQATEKRNNRRFFRWISSGFVQERSRAFLIEEGFESVPVPEVPGAWAEVDGPFPLGSSLASFFGLMYIQDLSSMLPAMLLEPFPGARVLDMCASPGGKTAQLAQSAGPEGLVVANEPLTRRLNTLRANLARLNLVNVVTTGYSGQDFPGKNIRFDCILVDAPCSGWGTVDKNPSVSRIWTQDKLSPLVKLQRELLARACSLLAPGGTLVYSTCTTNEQENQDQVNWLLERTGLTPSCKAEQLCTRLSLPGLSLEKKGMLGLDGREMGAQSFFMAALENPGMRDKIEQVDTLPPSSWEEVEPAKAGLHTSPENARLYLFGDRIFLVPDRALPYVREGLKIRGFFLGRKKKNRCLLSPRLRLFQDPEPSRGYNAGQVQEVRSIVSGQSMPFSSRDKTDTVAFFWKGLPLGRLKTAGSRAFWSEQKF